MRSSRKFVKPGATLTWFANDVLWLLIVLLLVSSVKGNR
jgi:hypothetical protein